MKRSAQFGLLLLLSLNAYSQHRGVATSRGFHGSVGGGFRGGVFHRGFIHGGTPLRMYGSPHGFGNVVFPGAGRVRPLRRPFWYCRRPFGCYYPYGFYRPWFYRPFWSPWIAPVTFPVFLGSTAYPYPPAPNVIIVYQGGDQENDPAEVQDGGEALEQSGRIRYEPPSRPASERRPARDKGTIYLFAFRDGTVAAVVAHWLEQDTLHYVTSHGAHKLVSLKSIDQPLTEQLNRERKVEIRWLRAR